MGSGDDAGEKKYEYTRGATDYLDSQWDAINRGNQRDLEALQKDQSRSPFSEQNSIIEAVRAERFFPNMPITWEIEEYELFKDDSVSSCVCKLNDAAVEAIAEAMFKLPNNVRARLQPAGYTYFSQLLTHDIVPSTTLSKYAKTSSALNLDSIYFDFAELNRWGGVNDDGTFVFTLCDTDLWREKWTVDEIECSGIKVEANRTEPYHFAVVPEHRNDGNTILSQLHLLLQKAHNHIVHLLKHADSNKKGFEYFEKAKEILVLLFQKLCINDLLKVTIDPDTYDYYFEHNGSSLFPKLGMAGAVPKEFTHAVSRYSHTMIRPRYKINHRDVTGTLVEDIFAKNRPIDKDLVIDDWDLFFDKPWVNIPNAVNKAQKIELRAAKLGVSSGPIDNRRNPSKNLATFDIAASRELCTFSSVMRNKNVRLFLEHVKGVDAQSYFGRIDYSKINKKLATLPGERVELDNLNSPFLLSMLLESHAMPQLHNRDRLGVVGSIVYAETIRECVNNAEINIFQNNKILMDRLDWGYLTYEHLLTSINPLNLRNLARLNL